MHGGTYFHNKSPRIFPDFLKQFWVNFWGSRYYPFSPCILNGGFYELSFVPVLFFKNRWLVWKNLKKFMKASLEISNQLEFFQKFRVNFIFLRADECIFNVRRKINLFPGRNRSSFWPFLGHFMTITSLNGLKMVKN